MRRLANTASLVLHRLWLRWPRHEPIGVLADPEPDRLDLPPLLPQLVQSAAIAVTSCGDQFAHVMRLVVRQQHQQRPFVRESAVGHRLSSSHRGSNRTGKLSTIRHTALPGGAVLPWITSPSRNASSAPLWCAAL